MATLEYLKGTLIATALELSEGRRLPLTDTQYKDGFEILTKDSNWKTYQTFILPQLSELLASAFDTRTHLSVLEIGPGPKTILGYLPDHLKRRIRRYTALEPNSLFAAELEEQFWNSSGTEAPLPNLEAFCIHRKAFDVKNSTDSDNVGSLDYHDEKYHLVLFCHSMYGMRPKREYVEKALNLLENQLVNGMVVVFHREGVLNLEGLVCRKTIISPTRIIRIRDDDKTLDCFALFIVGADIRYIAPTKDHYSEWRQVCRDLGFKDGVNSNVISFASCDAMTVLTKHATALPELTAQMPWTKRRAIKNQEARLRHPASMIKPKTIQHIQHCVQWALKHETSLIVIGGSHSGHCQWSNVVSLDMGAFNSVQVFTETKDKGDSEIASRALIVVESGCTTGDVVSKAVEAGVIVPLGARPSVGAGLWLQGGIGHLARLHGLACDAIVGAVVVSVESGQIFCVGHVPSQCCPSNAVRPSNELDLLWAIKGAGTNFGIVVSVTFKTFTGPTFVTRDWIIPLSDRAIAQQKLNEFDGSVAKKLPRESSADAYLYWEAGKIRLGITTFEVSTTPVTIAKPTTMPACEIYGPEDDIKVANSVGLFEAEMYVSKMHGGHAGGKTSSFKRCLYMRHIGEEKVAGRLIAAIESRPSRLCYLHLLHGGGAVKDVQPDATAFGCRDWDFACVITGVWRRHQDGSETARSAIGWVYSVAADLLPLSSGAYGADLGPDPRDAALAARAFGPNLPRLARLKRTFDPYNVLAYACPLLTGPTKQKIIILVTGKSGAGKDYCANKWAYEIVKHTDSNLEARVISISNSTKEEYAAATGANLRLLLEDRDYKEQHRPELTEFFREQLENRPCLLEEHFLNVVHRNSDQDVLLITGMREEAPVASLAHLVPDRRLVEVYVQASEQTRHRRRGFTTMGDSNSTSNTLSYQPCFTYDNDTTGTGAASDFARAFLAPFLHDDLQHLADMVRPVPDFPRPGIEFRHVLGITQQPGGLALCTSLLQRHFSGHWAATDAIVSCEAGGFVYASALASRTDVPLVLVREAGKLPPPTLTSGRTPSHISALANNDDSDGNGGGGGTGGESKEKRIEMERDAVRRGASVVVVDDVLATGETLLAVLRLLETAGVAPDKIGVLVVAEFPAHRGRLSLRQRGYGMVRVQSLLVFGGA